MFSLLDQLNPEKEAYHLTLNQLPKEDIETLMFLATYLIDGFERAKKRKFRKKEILYITMAKMLYLFKVRYDASNWYNSKLNPNHKKHLGFGKKYDYWNTLLTGEVYIFRSPQYYQKGKYPEHLIEKFSGCDGKPRIFQALDMVHEEGITHRTAMVVVEALEFFGIIKLERLGHTKFELVKKIKDEMMDCHKIMGSYSSTAEEQRKAESKYLKLQSERTAYYKRHETDYDVSAYRMLPEENWLIHLAFPHDEVKYMRAFIDLYKTKRRYYPSEKKYQNQLAKKHGAVVRNKAFDHNMNPLEKKDRNASVAYLQHPAPNYLSRDIQDINKKIHKRFPLIAKDLEYHRIFPVYKETDDVNENDVTEYGRIYSDFNSSIPKILKTNLINHYNYSEVDYDSFNLNLLFLHHTGKFFQGDIYTEYLNHIIEISKHDKILSTLTEIEFRFYRKCLAKPIIIQATNVPNQRAFIKQANKQIDKMGILRTKPVYRFALNVLKETYHLTYENEEEKFNACKSAILTAYKFLPSGNPAKASNILSFKSEKQIDDYVKRAISHYKKEYIVKKKRWDKYVKENGFDPSEIRRLDANSTNMLKMAKVILEPIKGSAFREMAGFCQRMESECTIILNKRMLRKKLLPLSIHDAILVPSYYKEYFKKEMEKALKRVVLRSKRIFKFKKSPSPINPFEKRLIELKNKYKKNKENINANLALINRVRGKDKVNGVCAKSPPEHEFS